jgi:hypothetical protein
VAAEKSFSIENHGFGEMIWAGPNSPLCGDAGHLFSTLLIRVKPTGLDRSLFAASTLAQRTCAKTLACLLRKDATECYSPS